MIKVGDMVEFISPEHFRSDCYPPVGTRGIVLQAHNDGALTVQWERGTTMGEGIWYTYIYKVRKV